MNNFDSYNFFAKQYINKTFLYPNQTNIMYETAIFKK